MVDALALLIMTTVSLGFLFVSLAFGWAISRLNGLAYLGVALLVGSFLWLGAIFFTSTLDSITFFVKYISLYDQLSPAGLLLFGNAMLTVVLSIIGIIELGMVTGYGIGRHYSNYHPSSTIPKQLPMQEEPRLAGLITNGPVAGSAALALAQVQSLGPLLSPQAPVPAQSSSQVALAPENKRPTDYSLSPDERIIAQLLLFGGVPEIKPRLDDKKPEGYYYEQLETLDWNTQRQALALNSLAKKGFLNTIHSEKILRCKSCGASGLEFRGSCPECGSLNLSRHRILEHFSCGMIERESAFQSPDGDLVCPKCNRKLELIGNDYRSLGQMYVCENCGALNRELSPSLKCRSCGVEAPPDEEREEILFSYSLNQNMLPKIKQYVKPVEVVVNYYRSRGYVVYSPAFVRGKSGTEQVFDLSIQETGERGSIGEREIALRAERQASRKILGEILVSNKAIELEDITREYGKISDVPYPAVVFVVPFLSDKAVSYAAAYRMRIFQGGTIEEALAATAGGLPFVEGTSSSTPQSPVSPDSSPGSESLGKS